MSIIRFLPVRSYFFNLSLSQAAFVKRLVERLVGSQCHKVKGVALRCGAEAAALREQSPYGLDSSSQSFALSDRRLKRSTLWVSLGLKARPLQFANRIASASR